MLVGWFHCSFAWLKEVLNRGSLLSEVEGSLEMFKVMLMLK